MRKTLEDYIKQNNSKNSSQDIKLYLYFTLQASTDQSVLDLEMAMRLGWCAFSIIQIIGTIVVMSQAAWEVFAIFVPITAACIWFQVSNRTPRLLCLHFHNVVEYL